MDGVPQFKVDGDLNLTVPLRQGFEKLIYDLVHLTASKSGFGAQESRRIAASVSGLVTEKTKTTAGTSHLQLFLAHGHGYVSIKTTIEDLNFTREERFQTR
jgi:hypothetical protein